MLTINRQSGIIKTKNKTAEKLLNILLIKTNSCGLFILNGLLVFFIMLSAI